MIAGFCQVTTFSRAGCAGETRKHCQNGRQGELEARL